MLAVQQLVHQKAISFIFEKVNQMRIETFPQKQQKKKQKNIFGSTLIYLCYNTILEYALYVILENGNEISLYVSCLNNGTLLH